MAIYYPPKATKAVSNELFNAESCLQGWFVSKNDVLLCPHTVQLESVTSPIAIATIYVIWRGNLHCTQVVATSQHVWHLSKLVQ